jgi:hypothetical protein
MTSVVVTGGRNYDDKAKLFHVLNSMGIIHLYVGDASGADALAVEWARYHSIPYTVFKADWDKHGRAAGPIRNGEMLAAAGVNAIVVAFPGGRGTMNCIANALRRGMAVVRVVDDSQSEVV